MGKNYQEISKVLERVGAIKKILKSMDFLKEVSSVKPGDRTTGLVLKLGS